MVGEDHVEDLRDGCGGDPVEGGSDVQQDNLACVTAGSAYVIDGAHETVCGVSHLLTREEPVLCLRESQVYLETVVVKFTEKFVECFQEADWSKAFWL